MLTLFELSASSVLNTAVANQCRYQLVRALMRIRADSTYHIYLDSGTGSPPGVCGLWSG